MSDNEHEFTDMLSGKADRASSLRAMKNGREQCRRPGLRPAGAIRPVIPFDVGGEGRDASGNLLYENHDLCDDDADDVDTIEAVWKHIPCEQPSGDESGDDSDMSYKSGEDGSGTDEDDVLSDASESSEAGQ